MFISFSESLGLKYVYIVENLFGKSFEINLNERQLITFLGNVFISFSESYGLKYVYVVENLFGKSFEIVAELLYDKSL